MDTQPADYKVVLSDLVVCGLGIHGLHIQVFPLAIYVNYIYKYKNHALLKITDHVQLFHT